MISPTATAAREEAARVVAVLRRCSQTVATAESLTGGLVGAAITEVPGASTVYRGGLITYATELKAELAGVAREVLAVDGPVSSTTAAQLAQGAARICGADWGLATTGVAGPDPQDGHPVGQVFVAVAGTGLAASTDGEPAVQVRELFMSGDRAEIRAQTVAAVLSLLAEHLGGLDAAESNAAGSS